mgnify:CR=1 FL=1
MKQEPEKKPEIPRLSPEIKKLNGKSGKRLVQCIDELCELLDEDKDRLPND